MTGTIEWINVDGTVRSEESKEPPSLPDMKDYVGGWIEVVKVLVDNEECHMIVNEEGYIQGLPVNVVASKHYATAALKLQARFPLSPIVGNAILLRGLELQ